MRFRLTPCLYFVDCSTKIKNTELAALRTKLSAQCFRCPRIDSPIGRNYHPVAFRAFNAY
jgi:hypothetical protein